MALQLLPRLSRDPLAWRREQTVGSRLPYLAQVDDHTVALRDGRLMQVIRLDGLAFETADTLDINIHKNLRDGMLQAIGSSQFAIHHHIVRRRVFPTTSGLFPDPFSQAVDDAWQRRLESRTLFTNDLFLTIVRRPSRAESAGAWFRRDGGQQQAASRAGGRRALDAVRDAMMATLSAYGPHLLSSYEHEDGALCSEVLEFLSLLYGGEPRAVRLPFGPLADQVADRRLSVGAQTIELAPHGHSPRSYIGMVSIKDYPGQTSPGMFDELLRLPYAMTMSQAFGFVDRGAGLGRINLTLRRMRAADDEALSLRGELAQARDSLAAGRAAFGEHSFSIAVRGDSPAMVDDGVAEVQAALTDLGMIAVREDIGAEPAFWAQFPGNLHFSARRALMSSQNFASLASCHNFASGQAAGGHWGQPISVLETTAAGPYHFHFHREDLGNFTVIGPSGSGKTVVLNFLLAQARRVDPRIVFFDKDRGGELFIRALGGRYDVLRPGEPAGFNPLRLADTPDNRRFLADWVAQLVADPRRPLDADDTALIAEAIDANMAAPLPYRRLRHFAELFRGSARPRNDDLAARLRPWWGNGDRAWLFDNAEDRLDLDARVLGVDMTRILDDPGVRSPAMMYLFHRVEERLDGSPMIIVVDEGWKALDDEVFVSRIRDWEKTIRKRNGIVGFATQSAEDALRSRIASAIVEQAATQIFMANPRAQARDYVEGFGLTTHELDLVRTMPPSSHCFLIKRGHDSVIARLDLSGEPELLTILSGRESSVRQLDAIRADVGDDPRDWMPRLLEAVP